MLRLEIDRFLLSKESDMLSQATIDWYAVQLRMLDEWLDTNGHVSVTEETLERYVVHLRNRKARNTDKPLSSASVEGAKRAIKNFFKWRVERKIVTESPATGLKLKKLDSNEPRQATRKEFDHLIASLPVDTWIGLRDHLLVHVIFCCGLRIGEALRLEAHHFEISEERQVLHIPGGKTGAGVVPLLRDVCEAYLAYYNQRPQWRDGQLFLSSDGVGGVAGVLTPSGARQMLERRCAAAGLRYLNPHAFRHGLAMHLLNDKRSDASMVQRILRHSRITTTTESYAKWAIDPLADEYRRKMEK